MEPSTEHLLQGIDFAYIGYIDDLLIIVEISRVFQVHTGT